MPEGSLPTPETTPEPDAQPPPDAQVSNNQAAYSLPPPTAQAPATQALVKQTPVAQTPSVQASTTSDSSDVRPSVAQKPKIPRMLKELDSLEVIKGKRTRGSASNLASFHAAFSAGQELIATPARLHSKDLPPPPKY
jgi:hypothetical protein